MLSIELCTLYLHDALPIFLLRSLIMFQTFISRHNSNFFSDKLVLTSVTPASSAPVLQTPKATSSKKFELCREIKIGRAVQQECRDRSRMLSSARINKNNSP